MSFCSRAIRNRFQKKKIAIKISIIKSEFAGFLGNTEHLLRSQKYPICFYCLNVFSFLSSLNVWKHWGGFLRRVTNIWNWINWRLTVCNWPLIIHNSVVYPLFLYLTELDSPMTAGIIVFTFILRKNSSNVFKSIWEMLLTHLHKKSFGKSHCTEL